MRSSHRKSRHGCRECKQRHKKCDESVPTCLNCTITNRSCSYRHTRPSYRPGVLIPTAPLPILSLSAVPPITQYFTQERQAQVYSIGHLELLHHFESHAFENASMLLLPVSTRRAIMQCALTNPYLMDQILALSAAHMSTLRRGQQQAFLNQATELQTRALVLFNRCEVSISKQNSPSWFLYAAFLGLQVMFETFQCNNFESFLGQLATFFAVHRGVHAVLQQTWPAIKDIVEEIVGQRKYLDSVELGNGQPLECGCLISLINDSGLEDMDRDACFRAIKILQRIFGLHRMDPRPHIQVPFTISWSILVPSRFADLLMKGTPEALIILSFYAVLLHRFREFWIFGDSGRFLIRSITAYLETQWAPWLMWPNQQLGRS